MRRLWVAAVLLMSPAASIRAQTPATAAPARITLAQFQGLRFLEGSWKGSGYQPGPFYESYRFVDDSTIVMYGWTDSTFTQKSDSSRYAFRNGEVRSRDGRAALMRMDSLGYHFQTLSGQRYGWTFQAVSADRWRAVLNQGRTVYTLDRVPSTWPRATPQSQGLDAAPIEQLVGRIAAHEFGHVDRHRHRARLATTRHVQHVNENPNSPGYGYQWWRYDRRGVDVWAGNGFGGQFLIIIPQARMVGVINGWNVFGERFPGTLLPTIDAMINAAGIATS